MNNELKEMLQSVIHEALKPIHAELKSVKTDLTVFRDEMIDFRDETRTDLRLLKDGQKGIQVQLHDRFSETRGRFDQVDRHLRLLESDFDLILQKSNEHERDINRLKRAE